MVVCEWGFFVVCVCVGGGREKKTKIGKRERKYSQKTTKKGEGMMRGNENARNLNY